MVDQCISYCHNDSIYQATSEDAVADDTKLWYNRSQLYKIHLALGTCAYLDELRLAIIPSNPRDSILVCESSKPINDLVEITSEPEEFALQNSERASLKKMYKSFCKGIAIVPIEMMSDGGDENCNLFYRYKED